jgi:putative transposase
MYRETKLSARKLANAFNRRYAATRGMTVGKTYVAQVIREYLYQAAKISERTKRHVPAPLPRNDTWGVDMTGKGDALGVVHPILGVIDHGSRMALAMHTLPDRTSLTLLKVVIAIVEMTGKPKTIRTDNEACFTSRLFRFGLSWLGIRHQRSKPGHPWQNGRIERLLGTLKEKLDQLTVFDKLGMSQALSEFQGWYNHVRPHQHLDGWTPWEALHGIDPYHRAPKSIALFSAWDGLLTGYYMRR